MTLRAVSDVENMFDFLLGVIAFAKGGGTQEIEDWAFDYSKMVLQAAEEPMKDLDLLDKRLQTLNEAERLDLNNDFKTAY